MVMMEMTENKRFTRIICSNDEYTGSLYCNDEPIKIDTVCNLLNELNDENTELKHYNEAYADEIVNIKHTIKTMLKNERTEIGKSTLKQLWEAIQ